MTQAGQQQIKQQLDELAQRGQASLFAVARAAARHEALRRSLWCFAPIVVIACLWQWLGATQPLISRLSFWAVLLLLPTLVFVGLYWLQLRTVKPARATALAMYDKLLNDDDRLQTADEFCQHQAPGPFQLAAILDSANAINQALTCDAPQPEHTLTPFSVFTRAQLPVTTVLLLLLWWQPFGHSTATVVLANANGATQQTDIATATVLATAPAKQGTDANAAIHTNELNSAADAASNMPDSALDSAAKRANNADAATNNPAAAAASSKTPATASTHKVGANQTSSTEAANSANQAAATGADAKTDNSAKADQSNNQAMAALNPPQTAVPLQDNSERQNANAQEGAMSDSTPNQDQQNGKPQNGNAQAGQQGQLAGKKQAPKSKNNQGQQQSGDQANPNSQNSGNHSDDGLKKSRGINSLMLSVPMEDQFVGTPGPGAEKRTMKQKQPDEQPNSAMPAAERGRANGAQAAQPARLMQPWELQLLGKFYQQLHTEQQNSDKAQ
ncbi:hypothetical protein JYB87_02525 [Shewanella avicenniae]|uniref:Uncharacterized protein n=1 Tax=Shewanella avicenniae TaxID=2814294 RepID=A0ABX7QT96_9GAMM|nr:hypothetical protein [Shewanella avicenniae]QSX34140.1 hypothetical protein JYB87_02525 [Shewanella avicenniae]